MSEKKPRKENLRETPEGIQEPRPEKRGYVLPIGPQHPMYVESENLMVKLDGETIVGVDVNIGYMHRGIEELMQRRNYIQGIFLAERICGICSGIHSVTYCRAVEGLLGIDKTPERSELIRTIVLELERLHSHFLFFGIAAYEIGMDSAFMYSWRDREHILDMLEMISGNRVNYGIPTIGGVRRDIPSSKIPQIFKILNHIGRRGRFYARLFHSDMLVRKRFKGKGILTKDMINKLSLVGPVARASGVKIDVRRDTPYLTYEDLDWKVITRRGGDAQARVMVKALEVFQSIHIIRECLRKLRRAPKELKVKTPPLIPANESITITEAPRGELVYYAVSNGTDRPERMRIKTPTFTNIVNSLGMILKGEQLGDLPVIVASVDPCFSCCDRVTLLDTNSGETRKVDATQLRRIGEK
jgi:NADH-quinone oxidoreductase subunit D